MIFLFFNYCNLEKLEKNVINENLIESNGFDF